MYTPTSSFRDYLQNAQQSSASRLVVIDADIADRNFLAAGVLSGSEVLFLEPDSDAIEQISTALQAAQQPPASLHIVAHGSPGAIHFTNGELTLSNLDAYASVLKGWFPNAAGTGSPEILIYGCRVAAGDAGQEFLQSIHSLTQAGLAAATHLVGSSLKRGAWQLNIRLGLKEPQLAFHPVIMASYGEIFPQRF